MSRPKPRIDTRASAGGLQNPFQGLDASGLPEGQMTDEVSEADHREPETAGTNGERLVLRKEKAHRGGKTVTIISGFTQTDEATLATLAHDLKRACGTGGTVKGGEIEIQGEKWLELAALLRKRGYRIVGLGA